MSAWESLLKYGKTILKYGKFVYFSHLGKMPEGGYLTAEGYPYSNQEIRTLTETRMKESANGGRAELNRIYPSREAYISTLYDQILGYIDGNRFMTMEKSAIALKMSNGTGQFIRDYMFPKSEGDTIETISEQLGAYRDIKEKIDVLENKIGMLKKVREAGQKLTTTRADIVKQQAMIRCIDIEDLKIRIDALLQDQERTQERLRELRQQEEELEALSTQLENELIVVSADLKSSDLGKPSGASGRAGKKKPDAGGQRSAVAQNPAGLATLGERRNRCGLYQQPAA